MLDEGYPGGFAEMRLRAGCGGAAWSPLALLGAQTCDSGGTLPGSGKFGHVFLLGLADQSLHSRKITPLIRSHVFEQLMGQALREIERGGQRHRR